MAACALFRLPGASSEATGSISIVVGSGATGLAELSAVRGVEDPVKVSVACDAGSRTGSVSAEIGLRESVSAPSVAASAGRIGLSGSALSSPLAEFWAAGFWSGWAAPGATKGPSSLAVNLSPQLLHTVRQS